MYGWLWRHLPGPVVVRVALAVVLGTIACVGNWSVVVVLPTIQVEFDTIRGGASLPYTGTMLGFAVGSAVMGRLADRFTVVAPLWIGAGLLCIGYVLAALSTDIWQFALVHALFIGTGSAAGFAPLMADLSHWFRKRRALAVTIAASGSYLAGAIWPLVIEHFLVALDEKRLAAGEIDPAQLREIFG